MLEYARWKYVVVLVAVLLSAIYALPNVFTRDPALQIAATRGATIDDALKKSVADALKKGGVTAKSIEVDGENLLVRLSDNDAQNKAADVLRGALEGGRYVVALNTASNVPAWLDAIPGAKPMTLGLDLQGGLHFLMEVDREAAVRKRFDAYLEDIRVALRDAGLGYESVERSGPSGMQVTLIAGADADKAESLVQKTMTANANRSGAAFLAPNAITYQRDGNVIRITMAEEIINQMTLDALEQNLVTLRNRVDSLGVAEPVIQRQGVERIVVQLPGVQDTAEAKRILGATATLEFRAVVEGDAVAARDRGEIPADAKLYRSRDNGPDGKPAPVLLNKRIIAGGEDLVSATTTVDQNGQPAVSVELSNAAGQRMGDFTIDNVGKPMAVVYIERIPELRMVDGKEVRSSRIDEEVINLSRVNGVFGKSFIVTGLGAKEAEDLAKQLNAGALAAPMDFAEQRVVGPSLGKQNVERGLTAVLYSFVFALLFFLVYYRMFGVITCLALLLNLLMVFALMSVFGATMSLPGLAGIALTVGMSVDANVLINERIREELRAGLPPQAAIATGYDRASGTILDANVTALLAGLAMFAFGTGPLKGFGLTTMLGIITSAYTAVSVSRAIATLIYGRRRKLKSVAI